MWKYLWFKMYLEFKDPLSYTGPECHAFEKFADRKVWSIVGEDKREDCVNGVVKCI